jgi:hypothetical protein
VLCDLRDHCSEGEEAESRSHTLNFYLSPAPEAPSWPILVYFCSSHVEAPGCLVLNLHPIGCP